MNDTRHTSRSPAETRRLAHRLLSGLRKNMGEKAGIVLALHGNLGSGKTCFVQGLADALNILEPVTSPTFTLIHEYHGDLPLYHIDLYRLQHPDEIQTLGLEEYMEPEGITAVEWAERAVEWIPRSAIHIDFTVSSSPRHREIVIRNGPRSSGRRFFIFSQS